MHPIFVCTKKDKSWLNEKVVKDHFKDFVDENSIWYIENYTIRNQSKISDTDLAILEILKTIIDRTA